MNHAVCMSASFQQNIFRRQEEALRPGQGEGGVQVLAGIVGGSMTCRGVGSLDDFLPKLRQSEKWVDYALRVVKNPLFSS